MCRASALWLMRLALSGAGAGDPAVPVARRAARASQISDEACMTAMQLVLPGGRTLAGADARSRAARGAFAVSGGWRRPRAPGREPLARRVYGWIAKNRMRLSCER